MDVEGIPRISRPRRIKPLHGWPSPLVLIVAIREEYIAQRPLLYIIIHRFVLVFGQGFKRTHS